jgi:branched-chain amino acid aminotransferase
MKDSDIKELYEVFRVEEGVALFLEDHLERLFRGASKARIPMEMDFFEMMEYVKSFLLSSSQMEGNVRLSFYFDSASRQITSHELRFVPHQYPTNNMYENGVMCGLIEAERDIPEAKIAQGDYRVRCNEQIQKNNIFEVFMTDRHGEITEGSRSNIFFIHRDQLITAPHQRVLPGVVRKKTLALAEKNNIPVIYRCINRKQELKEMDSAFLTGTSPRILPVKQIENIKLQPNHPLTKMLMSEFQKMVRSYIKAHKLLNYGTNQRRSPETF